MEESTLDVSPIPSEMTPWFVILLFVVCLVWDLSWVLGALLLSSWQDRGNFGDMFGVARLSRAIKNQSTSIA